LFSDWGFAPDTTEGAHSAPPNPLAGKGEGKRGEGERGKEGNRNWEGRERGEVTSS